MGQRLESNEINGKAKASKTYGIYTILFCAISFIVFAIFIKYNKSFIWQADGIKQHFVILYDFNQMVRNLFQNGIPMLSWNMGLGLDVIGQYSYYVIGDPFAYLSLLLPLEHLEITYNLLVLLRIYCVGLAFIAYCKYQRKENISTIIGAILYAFCGFILYAGVRHPYFTNAAILLPLNLIGVEKLLKENKRIFFIFIIFLSAISNYYFFYMITIVNVIYGIVKYVLEYNQGVKELIKKIGNAILCYIVGIGMASIILLPTIYTFLNSARTECEQVTRYIPQFYQFFFQGLICMRFKNWTVISVSSIVLLMIPVLFTKLKEKEIKSYIALFVITTIMLLLPQVASAMNGFSFPSNRWVFAYSFILGYIVTLCFDKKLEYSKKQKIGMFITIIIYSLIGVWITKFKIKSNLDYYASITIAFLILMVMSYPYRKEKNKSKANGLIFLLVISSIFVNSFALYSPMGKDYVSEFIENGTVEEKCASVNNKIENYKEAIEYIKTNDKDFYRIAKTEIAYQNLSLMYDYNPIQLFLSLGNGNVYNLSNSLEDNAYSSTQCVNGADRRTRFTTLLANKYYICDKKDLKYVPCGYSLYHEIGNTQIYINQNCLSIGLLYDSYITKEEYEELTPLEKEAALMTTAMVEEKVNIPKVENIVDEIEKVTKLNYKVKDNRIESHSVQTTKKNENIKLIIDKLDFDTEIYLSIKNLIYQSNTEETKFSVTASLNGVKNSENVQDCISSAYYMKNPDFLMNLGIGKNSKNNELTIKFDNPGIYTFDSIEVLAVPMDKYVENVIMLKANEMQKVQYGNNFVSGVIDTNKNGILQITTSYSDGWKAYVDDEEVEVFKVNEAFVGIEVEQGKHNIRFQYTTPYLKLGMFFSVIAMIAYLIIIVIDREKK